MNIITNKKGFTLIELIIVMVIIAILGLGVNALIGDTTSTKAYGTARKIQSDIIFAQESAMSHRIHYRITFSTSPNNYTIQQCTTWGGSSCTTWGTVADPSTNTTPFTVTLNSGSYSGVSLLSTGFTGNYLEFNSAGTPLDGNTSCGTAPCSFAAVESVTINPGSLTVSVAPGTGKTSIP
jgi:prepilin-type N-terminal cleavage/methylation domain-containing protein